MLSEKNWKRDGLLQFTMCLLVCLAFMVLLASAVQHFMGAKPDDNTPVLVVLRTLALHGSILIAVFFFLRLEHMSWAQAFGFNTPPLWRALMWGTIVAMIFAPLGQELNGLCARALESVHVQPQSEQAVESLQKATPGFTRVYLIFFAVIIAPVVEEIFFRGILYASIKQFGFPRAALWSSSILFALIHENLSAFLPLLLFAAVLAILYDKTNNLLACILAHSLFNASAVVLVYHYSPAGPQPY